MLSAKVAMVPMHQRKHAASCAAGSNPQQTPDRRLAKVRREIRNYDEMIFLGDLPGRSIVFGNGRVFVAQIHLDDLLHMLGYSRESVFNLVALRPDSAVENVLFVIRQMRDTRKILSKLHRINDRKTQLSRRRGREQAKDDRV